MSFRESQRLLTRIVVHSCAIIFRLYFVIFPYAGATVLNVFCDRATIRSHLKHPVKHLADVLLVTPAIVVINHEDVQFLVAAKLLALSTSTSMNRFFGCDRQIRRREKLLLSGSVLVVGRSLASAASSSGVCPHIVPPIR